MRKYFTTLLTTTAVLAALAGGSVLYAYADSPNSQSSGGMMQGGQGGMMGMMNMMGQMNQMMGQMNQRQMNQMMETGNNMMKQIPQHPGTERPEERKNPEQKG